MKKLGRKALALSLSVAMGASMLLTGCGGGSDKSSDTINSPEDLGVTTGLDKDTKGDISIMVWSGDGNYYEDIGNPDSAAGKKLSDPKNIVASNVATVYAVAQKFHEAYPNIKVNLWSKIDDPDQYNTSTWEEEMENFKAKYKKYPDIWASTDVPGDVKKGLAADLSAYSDDEVFKTYNKSLMTSLNYDGFQAGLPSYTIPWGIWVNKSLAEDNNISVPDPDWTIDEFTRFVSKADGKNKVMSTSKGRVESESSIICEGGSETSWYKADGTINYPPNNGAVPGTEVNMSLKPGDTFGRYGNIGNKSNFVTQTGANADKLALPPTTDPNIYQEFRVIKEIPNTIQAEIAAWGGSAGGGLQYELPMPILQLIREGYIVPK